MSITERLKALKKECENKNSDTDSRDGYECTCKNGENPSASECLSCGEKDCPNGDPLHYHHDGCPSCYFDEPEKE